MLALPMDSSALNWMESLWQKHPRFAPKLSTEQLRTLDACLKEYFRKRAPTQTQEASREVPPFMNVEQEPPKPENQYLYPRPKSAQEEVVVLGELLQKVTGSSNVGPWGVLMWPTMMGESPLWVKRLDDRDWESRKGESDKDFLRGKETAQKVWEAVQAQARRAAAQNKAAAPE